MKTFKDLEFKSHIKFGVDGRACLLFDNGYGVSVVYGDNFVCRTSKIYPYEMAVIKHEGVNDESVEVLNILPYLTKERVIKYMIEIQKLK